MARMRSAGRRPVAKGPSLREQGAAFTSPSIAGQQPTGDLFGAYNSGDTMSQIRRNEFLNTLDEPAKMAAMNQMGYFTGGDPARATRGFTPGNQYMRGINLKPGQSHNVETGGVFQGQITNQGGENVWNPLRPQGPDGRAVGGGKMIPKPVHTQIGNPGARKAGQLRGPDEGRPVIGKPGAGVGGGGGFGPAKQGGMKPGAFKPGGFPQQTGGGGALFPKAAPQVPGFLPMTPGYEADYRGANDQLAAAEGVYAASGELLPAQFALQRARLGTDQDVATDRLKEQLAERGIYTPYSAQSTVQDPQRASSPAGGGVGEALYNRQVATPFGRATQDLGATEAEAYRDRALDYGGAQLGFNQQMLESLLQRGEDAYAAMPLSLPIGGYELPAMPGPMFSAPPGGAGKQRPSGKRGGRNHRRGGGRK